jgi:hypothetical protein
MPDEIDPEEIGRKLDRFREKSDSDGGNEAETAALRAERDKLAAEKSRLAAKLKSYEGQRPELEKQLVASLEAKVLLYENKEKPKIITRYRLSGNLKPTDKEYSCYLSPQDAPNSDRENRRMHIRDFHLDKGSLYVLVQRDHDDPSKKEYRLIIFDEKTGERKHLSPKIEVGSKKEHGITSFTVANGRILIAKRDKNGTSICEYSARSGKLEEKAETEKQIDAIFPYKDDLILVSRNDFYLGEKHIHHTDSGLTGFVKVLEKQGILFYGKRGSLCYLDIENGRNDSIPCSDGCVTDVIETKEGGIQVITSTPKGLDVSEYKSKEDLFENKGATYLINGEVLEGLSAVFSQDQRLFYAARDPNEFFAVYHKGRGFVIKQIGISNFDSIGGRINGL